MQIEVHQKKRPLLVNQVTGEVYEAKMSFEANASKKHRISNSMIEKYQKKGGNNLQYKLLIDVLAKDLIISFFELVQSKFNHRILICIFYASKLI